MSWEKVIHQIESVAERCRESDIYYKDEAIEIKSMLNDVGKILEKISHLLFIYKHADEDRRLEIRKKIHRTRQIIEKEVSEE